MFDPLIRIDPSICANSGTFGFGRGGSAAKLGGATTVNGIATNNSFSRIISNTYG